MSRFATIFLGVAMAGGGYWLGTHASLVSTSIEDARAMLGGSTTPRMAPTTPTTRSASKPSGVAAYYRDPDGKPVYADTPRTTADGRAFVAVDHADDVQFDGSGTMTVKAEPAPTNEAAPKIKFYRNPMGLPDTSPTPKKDSMGMDYLPVYRRRTRTTTTPRSRFQPAQAAESTGVRSVPSSRDAPASEYRWFVRRASVAELDERRQSRSWRTRFGRLHRHRRECHDRRSYSIRASR